VKDYSGGMRRRLDIAASLIVTPGVLFLDGRRRASIPLRAKRKHMIRQLAESGSLTTQYMDDPTARRAHRRHQSRQEDRRGRRASSRWRRGRRVARGARGCRVRIRAPRAKLGATVKRSVEGATLSVVAKTSPMRTMRSVR
jgi:ABC-2 type transport system ATP-binding protein